MNIQIWPFMRTDCSRLRGQSATSPHEKGKRYTIDKFILVMVDVDSLDTAKIDQYALDLDSLMIQYPDEQATRTITDEDGKEVVEEYAEYGYFSELGVSSFEDAPLITVDDLGGK